MLDTIYSLLNQGLQFFMTYILIFIVIAIISIISWWILFKRANKKGWYAIIPFYNTYILFLLTGINPIFLILFFIPVINFIAIPILMIMVNIRLSHSFGKNTAFAFGIILLPFIFYPLLAFSKNTMYLGPNGVRKFDSPQPTSSDYSKPQNYRDTEVVKKQQAPVISMGSGDKFNSAPVAVIPNSNDVKIEDVDNSINDSKNKEIDTLSVKESLDDSKSIIPDSKPLERNTFLGGSNPNGFEKNSAFDTNNIEVSTSQMSSFLTPPKPPEKATFIVDAELPQQVKEHKVCSNCGAHMNASGDTCFLCGNKM